MDRLASLSYCELCPAGKVVPLNWFTLTGTAAITSNLREVACIDCEAGKSRALAQLDTVCTTCSSGRYAGGGAAQCHQCPLGLRTDINTSGATECISCPAGSQTNAHQTDCEQCQAHESSAFGGCQTCTPGKEPNEARSMCQPCAMGWTGKRGQCNECEPGRYYSAIEGQCTLCNELKLPSRFEILNVPPPVLESHAVCPGGIPGQAAGFCPMRGLWVRYPVGAAPELLACESAGACLALKNCSDSLMDRGVNVGANLCGEGTGGFMCRDCIDGYTKVAGRCFECDGYNWSILITGAIANLLTALFLLHKSTTVTISGNEAKFLWDKVDLKGADVLDMQNVGRVFQLLGKYFSDERLQELLEKEFYAEAPRFFVRKESFVHYATATSPTAAMGTAIFFVQTFALLAKDASFFGLGTVLNLDPEESSGKCMSPLSYTQRYLAKAVVMPAIMLAGVFMTVPLWYKLRQCAGDRIKATYTIDRMHLKRAMVNTFLYCFAPLTRTSIETLVCVDTCTDDDDPNCMRVLSADMAVECWTGEHAIASIFAAALLLVLAVIVPTLLLRTVRRARKQRDASLMLRADQVDKWFDELDADHSGSLESSEITELHKRMGQTLDVSTLDPDGDGEVTKQEFTEWYHGQLTAVLGEFASAS